MEAERHSALYAREQLYQWRANTPRPAALVVVLGDLRSRDLGDIDLGEQRESRLDHFAPHVERALR